MDSLADRAATVFCEEVLAQNQTRGRIVFVPAFFSLYQNIPFGSQVGATPDGRKRGDPISENFSPAYGADRSGLTALLHSMARLPFHLAPQGGTNVMLDRGALRGDGSGARIASVVRTFFGLGGHQLGLTAIDRATLEDARAHPERHHNLTVRVTGYSAYFVQLDAELQEAVIARQGHQCG